MVVDWAQVAAQQVIIELKVDQYEENAYHLPLQLPLLTTYKYMNSHHTMVCHTNGRAIIVKEVAHLRDDQIYVQRLFERIDRRYQVFVL
jgi:hypothetical protein